MDTKENPIRLLFLGEQNGCRSPMAEAFARTHPNSEPVDIFSAGLRTGQLEPAAVQAMAEQQIDISKHTPRTLADVQEVEFDVVVTMSKNVSRKCPILSGNPHRVDWSLDGAIDQNEETEAVTLEEARGFRDVIDRLVSDLFEQGYLSALALAKRQADLILDNVSEGIIAHDFDRRIFYFNHAAETITEYPRREVIGRDCHQVFPGGLCGSKCLFRDGEKPAKLEPFQQSLEIRTRSGERRQLENSVKPMVDSLGRTVGVLSSFRDRTRERDLERRLGEIEQFSGIIGRHPRMLEVFDLIRDVADSSVSVLIQGESGTGKELVAAAIHRESSRANHLFVPVNCAALPEGLLESELFGHVRGAFTGAIRDKKGRFELADKGTIFLDEIGDLPPVLQVKLLRVLQEGVLERVGSEKPIKVDVRVISATNRDLQKECAESRFREDLYYRLAVVPITIPPLRSRRIDIPLLAEHTLKRFLKEMNREPMTLSQEALDAMLSYDWPGNVRELQNWIQFALVKCKGPVIERQHLPIPSSAPAAGAPRSREPEQPLRPGRPHKLTPRQVAQALAQTEGNKAEAARVLGVSRATLYRFLARQEKTGAG